VIIFAIKHYLHKKNERFFYINIFSSNRKKLLENSFQKSMQSCMVIFTFSYNLEKREYLLSV